MKQGWKPVLRILFFVILLAALILPGVHRLPHIQGHDAKIKLMRAVLDLGDTPTNRPGGLIYGYNWWLLSEFSQALGTEAQVNIFRGEERGLDSLLAGATDIAVMPFETEISDSVPVIILEVDSTSIWLFKNRDKKLAKAAAQWLDGFVSSDNYTSSSHKFRHVYNPWKRRSNSGYISPYDSLFQYWGGQIGHDWRLLAAIAWQESHFRIDVMSKKGALGIMQVMPRTARRYGGGNLSDPEVSIMTGALLLKDLSREMRPYGENLEERMKFILAAYNAGASRVKSYAKYASYRGAGTDTWDAVAGLLPELQQDTLYLADSVSINRFNYTETVHYVNRVMSLWREFRRISPDAASEPDQPKK